MQSLNRRRLLQAIGAIGTAPVWSRLASLSALAATTPSTYKAAVCIALRGGNDANNLIVPLDRVGYSAYAQARGALALPYASLLPLGTTGAYGIHPALVNVQAIYNRSAASVISGIGALHSPTTKAAIQANVANLPPLFSHPSGKATWESGEVNSNSTTGWGGRIVDALGARTGSLPGVISLAGNSLYLIGANSPGFTLAQSTNFLPSVSSATLAASTQLVAEDARSQFDLVRLSAAARTNMLSNQAIIGTSLGAGGTLQTSFPDTSLGSNLKTVAKLIAGRGTVGADRQMFFCQQDGFDTHEDQLNLQNIGLSQLDGAIGSFQAAMQELGLQNQVLLFTISDFSRTLQPNTTNGTDHGWAGHQIVLGGGISGGRMLGTMPNGELGGADDMTTQGAWIPTTSSVQLAAGIAKWMGVADSNVAQIFPDLSNFSAGAISLS